MQITVCPNCEEPVQTHARTEDEHVHGSFACPLLRENVRRAIAVAAAIFCTREYDE